MAAGSNCYVFDSGVQAQGFAGTGRAQGGTEHIHVLDRSEYMASKHQDALLRTAGFGSLADARALQTSSPWA
jgi:hypothetical protein